MFTQVSTESIPGGWAIRNGRFGNRCVICGSYFDECGICNYGHQQGQTYYYPPDKKPKPKKSATVRIVVVKKMVTCEVFNGCRCTICGGFFGDGDTICASGHEIGAQYLL